MEEHSAGFVIFREDKFLVLHYDAGHWDLAKGHIEKGETDQQAAIRELEEETGITDFEIIPGFSCKIHYFFKRDGKPISKNVTFFLAKVKEDKIKLSFEHKNFDWLSFEDALNRLTFDSAREVLRKAKAFIDNVKE